MRQPRRPIAQRIGHHLQRRVVAGVLLLIPIAVTYFLLRWLFLWVDNLLQPALAFATTRLFGHEVVVRGAGIVAVVLLVYLLGLLAGNVAGRFLIRGVQQVLLYVPVVNTVYRASKQFVDVLSGPSEQEYRRVVMLELPVPGVFAVGFLTGSMMDENGQQLGLVYVPTSPMPNSGWLTIIPIEKVFETDMTVGEAMRMVISGGALAPAKVKRTKLTRPVGALAGRLGGPPAAPRKPDA